ncbi:MAG TPA: ABC transporter ATP-binding protein, partial [Candidatus Acetothermia bacterium]|nr:ABC transporter ATP-binding protein [Candidatus Acetothermia bacterium]
AIARGEKIALVGDNGVGKSTLLSIIAGAEKASGGTIHHSADLRIGYLPQVARLEQGKTLAEAMLLPFADLISMEQELRVLEEKMASSSDPQVLHRYDDLLHAFSRNGGYEIEARIRSVLVGVGFATSEFDKQVSLLSGGEEARAALARVLSQSVDLLMLDEPTNHLDFAALDWLEEELLDFPGALLVVSHDRHLLDQVTNRTWEIVFGEINTYRGGYTASRVQRDAQIARRHDLYEEQQATVARYKDFIHRHHAGQKHRQAKDRERKLAHLEEQLVERPRTARQISLQILRGTASGKKVLTLSNLRIGYDSVLFSCPNLVVDRGERIVIIGENGCGKTSLLKTITGDLPPFHGSAALGHGVRPVVYTQKQEGLHGSETVIDMILSRSNLTIGQARGLLGRFLFSGDDVMNRLRDLSGGERSRVALAILSLVEGNLLLLDEPTNHLDLRSQEILEKALLEYAGTIILVSHDRALLEAVATQVWQIGGGKLRVFRYGFSEYRRRRALISSTQAVNPSKQKQPKSALPKPKEDRYQQKKRQEALAEVEKRIEIAEEKLSEIEKLLVIASEEANSEKIAELGRQHSALAREIEDQMQAWEETAGDSPRS